MPCSSRPSAVERYPSEEKMNVITNTQSVTETFGDKRAAELKGRNLWPSD
jgi:hypothetical protein